MAFPTSTSLTKHLLAGVATTALSLGIVASASAQNSSLAPTFGDITQSQGFGSTSITIQAGGSIDANTFAGSCNGYIADAPDYAINYNGQLGLLIEAASNDDTTIIVEMPDGAIFCNDDFSGLNPGVELVGNEPGRYAIWVGTYNSITSNTYPDADIFISEISGPTPTPTPTPTPGAGLDPFAAPAFGTITVAGGSGAQGFDLQAGGEVDAFAFDNRCSGYVASAPDYVVDYQGRSGVPLDFSVSSDDDTTLVVIDPNGNVFCNDDFGGSLNPALTVSNPVGGQYAVWVGTFSSAGNSFPDALLTVSTASNSPTPTPPAPTPGAGLDPFAAPAFGTIAVGRGFGTQSFDMQAGGEVDAFAFDNRCAGYVASAPDYVVDYQGQSRTPLEISAASGDDTTLVVMDPNGNVLCNDDANGTLDPSLNISNPVAGNYAVWVGTFSSAGNNFPETVLTVSSGSTSPTPRPTPTTPRPTAGLDANQAPTFDRIDVGRGFGSQTFDLQAGGDIEAYNVYNQCNGHVAGAPDFVVNFQGSSRSPLNLNVFSQDDTTLVVLDPNGNVLCNDDDVDLNPALSISNPITGDYAVWVGTFSPIQNGVFPEAQLTVSTASSTPTPRPVPATPTPPTTNGNVDFNAAPTFGSVNLGSNLSAGHSIMLQAGGFTDAFNVNQACNGWIAEVPDYVVSYAGGRMPMTIGAESDADTTLVVVTPDGQVLCNDDAIDLNPGITINNPGPGDYAVFVGTYLPIENQFFPDALLTVSGEPSGRPLTPVNPGNFNQRALQTPTFGSVNLANGFASHAIDLQAGGALEGFEFGGMCNGFVADAPDYVVNYGGGSDLQITATSDDDTTMTIITPSGEVLCNDDFGDLNPGMFINDAGAGSYAIWVGTYLPIENDFYPTATLRVAEVTANKTQPSGAITSTSLTAGFTPDPFTTVLAAGGPIDAGTIDGMCNGFIASEPDFELNYTSGDWPLRIYVTSDNDTTLLMRTPSGEIMCNDDFDGLNPSLSLSTPASGIYEVFIGTYNPTGGNPNATLAVTELLDQKDLPPGAVIETSIFNGMQREDFDLIAGGSFQAFETLDQSCGGYVANAPDFLAYVEDAGVDVEMTVRAAEDTTLAVRTPSGQFICDDDAGGDFNPLVTLPGAQVGAYEVWLGTFSSVGNAPATLSIRDMNAGSGTPPNVPGGGKK